MSEPAPPLAKPEFTTIEDLFSEIQAGRLRVPRFQRPFVWKPENMLSLFVSLNKGYPIGSLLFWDTSIAVSSADRIGPLNAPPPPQGAATYVIDGQQRLLTLYGTLRLPADYPADSSQDHWQWWIYYDLKKGDFLHRARGEALQPHMFPLRSLLKTTDFLRESRRIEAQVGESEGGKLIEEAERLAQKLKSYKVMVVRIQGGQLDDAVDIFSRLNTTGQKMTPDQMFAALTYREGGSAFNLARRLDEISARLGELHFGNLRRLVVFRSVVAAAVSADVYDMKLSQLNKKDVGELAAAVDAVEESLYRAVEFLAQHVCVPCDKLFPYSSQLIPLSEMFRLCPEPTAEQKATLEKWFWATSFSGWFAGVNSTNMREMILEFRKFAKGESQEPRMAPLDDPARPFPTRFDLRSARLRALLLTMIRRLVPKSVDGTPVEGGRLVREIGHRAFIHVFRRAPDDIVSNPANRVLLSISRGQSVRRMLLDLPEDLREPVLLSHGISEAAFAALRDNDPAAFVKARALTLAQMERDFMTELGIPLPAEEFGEADIDTDLDVEESMDS